jgi:hypothetical protein
MRTAIRSPVAGAAALLLSATGASAGPCSQEISNLTKALAAKDAGSGPTTGHTAPMAGDQKGQHPGTSLMSKETEGKATSAEDVQRQSGMLAEASRELDRARGLDAQGNEAACMDAVQSAKQRGGL